MSVHPRRATTGGAAGLVMALTLLIGGCVAPTVVAPTSRPPTPTPVFASDEEALAAAEQAYADYQSAVDFALTTYDTSALRIAAQGDALESALESVSRYEHLGQRLTGRTRVMEFQVTTIDRELMRVEARSCIDVSSTDVIDADGVVVTAPGRYSAVALDVSLRWSHEADAFQVASDVARESGDKCAG